MIKSKLWTKDFIIISATTFFVALTFYLLMTTMTMYAIERFNASQSQAGLASGIFVIGALLSRLLAGKYMEIIGRKKMLGGSLGLFLIATLLYFLVDNLSLLLVVRFIHGATFGVATTAMPTAIMDIIPVERRGEGIGYFSLSPTLATAIGPFLGILIMQYADFNMLFAICTGFSVMSSIIILLAQIPEAKITKKQREAMKGFTWQDFFEISAIPISMIMLLMGMAYSGILAFLNSYAIEINLTTAASFFFIVYAVFILISRPFTGRLLDVKGDNIVMYPALLLFTLSLVLLSQAESGFILLLAGALVGLGFGTIMSCAQAIATKEAPQHRIGLATATYFFCSDVGMGTGPILVGSIIPIVGFRGTFMTLAVAVFLSIGLYYLVHGKKAIYRNQPAHVRASGGGRC
ncbi:Multidrug resistance protein MdtG [bioreactor metagenome]|uniref:Multidrug resistance protein MdtG n=1 Tax=bioreactor metagenome TaxID=1076179 RepID=A0A644TFL7_9ZZZZ|nr:MFS transporter [Negativicutes bacterium]